MKKLILAFILAVAMAFTAYAEEVIITSGGSKGTYYPMVTQVQQACSSPTIRNLESKGTIENIDRMLNNEATAAIVQIDGLYARKLIDNDQEVDRIKKVMDLYPEEVHFLASYDNPYIYKFSDLGNKRWGVKMNSGSLITARVLSAKTRVMPMEVIQLQSDEEGLQKLDAKQIDVLITVGGKPLPLVKNLPGRYKLVPFDMAPQVADIYQTATLSYPNLSANSVPTVSVMSVLVTMDYKTAEMRNAVRGLKACIVDRLPLLQEKPGSHPKWRMVNPDYDRTKWPKYAGLEGGKK